MPSTSRWRRAPRHVVEGIDFTDEERKADIERRRAADDKLAEAYAMGAVGLPGTMRVNFPPVSSARTVRPYAGEPIE